MDSNTCAGADASLPQEFLDEIRKSIARQRQSNGGKCAWEVRGPVYANGTKMNKQVRTNLDDYDCCMLEDLGGKYCGKDNCCLAEKLKDPGVPNKKVVFDDKTGPNPKKPL